MSNVVAEHDRNNMKPDILTSIRQSVLLHVHPESSFFSSMHTEGYIHLKDSSVLPVNKVLFDTGALHSSYLSENYFNSYKEQLLPYATTCQNKVRLADNKTTIDIQWYNWDGINNIEPLQLHWLPGLPSSMKPRARPVNPKLYEHAKKEFE
eukprot:scaffold3085_cov211-Ochromonas_danica.AAC.1